MQKLLITFFLIYLTIPILQCQSDKSDTVSNSDQSNYFVAIDPGHGGKDPGAISYSDSIMEKDVVLQLSKTIKSKLEHNNIKTLLLRENDRFIPLKERIGLVDQSKAEINITVHMGDSNEGSRNGYKTFYQENNPKSKILDHLVHEELNQLNLLQDNGSQVGPFYMLTELSIPSIMIDLGYISNSTDLQKIMNLSNQDKLAESILKAVRRYQNI